MERRRRRVLVADADDMSLSTLRHQLIDAGYEVCTTTSGHDVVMLCELQPPDVLIMDIHLPDMDGFEVCERVRHENAGADITVLIMTEAVDDMTHSYLGQMVEYAGGDYFLAKPYDLKLLLMVLDDLTMDSTRMAKRSRPASRLCDPMETVTHAPSLPRGR
ncbi:MAG: PleD family two-component system response regulator [Phycisphaerae bacterium]